MIILEYCKCLCKATKNNYNVFVQNENCSKEKMVRITVYYLVLSLFDQGWCNHPHCKLYG